MARNTKFDVVIVGSGMGGLCAGALLAKAGYRTLILEKRERIGGRFSTQVLEGVYKFPTGAVYLHQSGYVPQVLQKLGIRVELREVPEYVCRIEGREYVLTGRSRLRKLLDIISKNHSSRGERSPALKMEVPAEEIMNSFRDEVMQAVTRPAKRKAGLYNITVRDWLLRFTENPFVHDLFDTYCTGFAMARACELPASELFYVMGKTAGMTDVWMVPRGNITVMEELARVVKTNGDVWTNCRAKKIIVKEGAAKGVVIEKDGKEEEIPGKVVIANGPPRHTVELAGVENFTEEYLREMRVKMRPHPCVFIAVAAEKPICLEKGQRAGLNLLCSRRIQAVLPLTNVCPELAPPGEQLIYLIGEPRSTLQPMDEKYEIEQCLLDIKEHFPNFEKYGRILMIDPHNVDHDLPESHGWETKSYFLPVRTPVRNLYSVGEAVTEPGIIGTSGCAGSGLKVAGIIQRTIRPG